MVASIPVCEQDVEGIQVCAQAINAVCANLASRADDERESMMNRLKILLAISTIAIYVLTVTAIHSQGWNWPAVAIADLLALNWRSQFDFDFVVHLLLLATWVVWREGASAKAYGFGLLSIVLGGMFSFPYLIYAIIRANGDPRALLLGVNAGQQG